MTDKKNNDVLLTYVGDMHALVSHGITAIGRQVDNLKEKGPAEALAAVQEFHRVLGEHEKLLEARATALGGSTSKPVKDAASAVAGVAAGLINAVRTEEASKSVRDDYTYLSHLAVAFLMLHTTASGLGDQETASLAERGYRDAAKMVMRVDQVMPSLVLNELRKDGLQVNDVSAASKNLIKSAWERGASATGLTLSVHVLGVGGMGAPGPPDPSATSSLRAAGAS